MRLRASRTSTERPACASSSAAASPAAPAPMTITSKTCVATLFDLHPDRSDHFTPELDLLADLLRKLLRGATGGGHAVGLQLIRGLLLVWGVIFLRGFGGDKRGPQAPLAEQAPAPPRPANRGP